MIVLLDYGMGNVGSVLSAFKQVGTNVQVSSEAEVVSRADRLVIPGVGSFDSAMQNISRGPGLLDAIKSFAMVQERPILGICLGAQLLMSSSDEGKETGLDLIPGAARRLSPKPGLKIPHTGWNDALKSRDTNILKGREDWRFYFVHSFAPYPEDDGMVLARTVHGDDFPCVIGDGNIIGVQFHPERSHSFGRELLTNFLKI